MCAGTTPAVAVSGPNTLPASCTPSIDPNITASESASACSRIFAPCSHGGGKRGASVITEAIVGPNLRRTGWRTGDGPRERLLAQLHPLVARPLQKLLVLLLPHLLAALLDQRRQAFLTLGRLTRFRTGSGGRRAWR